MARSAWLSAALLSAGASALGFAWLGDRELNLADEGFLWYGVKRVLEGEVPLRDFQAYEPGRYVWCALLAPLFGSGILGVRASVALFQALGLFFGLLAARRLGRRAFLWQLLVLPILWLWMFPRHKIFEPAIALALVWGFVRLLEHPTLARRFGCGLLVGIAACFGRNHALYGTLAAFLVFVFLEFRGRRREWLQGSLAFAVGALSGSAPLWLALLLVPGLGTSFLEEVLAVGRKGANLPLPWPWPWRISLDREVLAWLAEASLALAFLLPGLALAWGAVVILRLRVEEIAQRALLVAGFFVGIPYLHHAVVRSDLAHLAQCIHPLLLVLLALPRGPRARGVCAAALLGVSALVATEHNALLYDLVPWHPATGYLERSVAGETLRLAPGNAGYLDRLEQTVDTYVGPDEQIFIAPSRPALYPVLGKRSPVRQIYFLWFASPEEEEEIVERLEQRAVEWVLLVDTPVGNREELRFASTHPHVMDSIERRFERVPTPLLPPENSLWRRRPQ